MSEIRVTNVVGENGSDPVGLSTGFTVGPTSGTTATITHEGQASFTGIVTATTFVPTAGQLSHRNKIINGDFTVHQRGGTIASSNGVYTLDRWRTYRAGDSTGGFSVQQSTGSYPQTNISGVIDNFKASALITVTSAGSAAANNNCKFQQRIEGSNVYDLAFGTAAAKKVTVSFYVKCSITGTFGIALVNGGHNRSNVQTYTVNSTSTWERKIVTFNGDTSGTWNFNTGTGLQLMFDMGSGSDKHTGSLNTWVSGEKHGTTSSTKLIHTNGATIQYAGVQLEAGPVATPFEHRSYGEELERCQRYYETSYPSGYSAGHNFNDVYPFNTSKPVAQNYIASDDTLTSISYPFMVNKRSSPTVTIYSAKDGASGNAHTYKGSGGTNLNVALNVIQTREQQMMLGCSLGAVNQANEMYFHYVANSEL